MAFPLAFAAGAAAVLALPPFSVLPAALLAYSALFLLVADAGPRRGLALGWAFGLAYFAFGLSWIAESFAVDAERFGWMAVPAVAGLSALLALFPALACAAFTRVHTSGATGAVLFATCWTAAEWLRGHVLTGFPWNLTGYALAEFDMLRQSAAWTGSYGLSFLVVLASVLPAAALRAEGVRRTGCLVLFGVLCLAVLAAGWLRLAATPPEGTGVRLRIVQGNIAQAKKWLPDQREAIFARYLRLSAAPGAFDVLLWPETAFPGDLDEDPAAVARIARMLAPDRILLTGVPERVADAEGTRYFNTIQAYDAEGGPVADYAKHHLVPFGEYVPRWLPIGRLVETPGDFTPGPGPRTLALPGLPLVGAAMCYEIIFPGHVADDAIRPDWIFNATNDAWFGTSIGPRQHLASARMRAVEEGLPVVRAANTGISAVIDAEGRIRDRLGMERTGIIDAELPAARPPTLYARLGDLVLPPLVLAALLLAWLTDGGAARLWRRT
ncbi:apolipoprotein N-acyltransferase [Jannaschia rubra]|uniref:Apolipoprotein N-acyltransferase n=1 Tax=Jannaschia rubra TaxID=282197 RepID=A0A0M6XW91_9RHOB|nr:apolipoprotein N-acyltransferase [Jannaschia rubra]CTQ34551.1 Apolipoprotein N-acyltransferase [Jannaschia rubra]